ncbi:MAG: hypothetical protein PUG54_11925 [Firmicutes bacterium]|nr:hypothetical protein [Bacillota bacterium]
MKRLKQWFVKLDTIWIMLFALVILVYAYTREADASIKLYYTTFGIPIFFVFITKCIGKEAGK